MDAGDGELDRQDAMSTGSDRPETMAEAAGRRAVPSAPPQRLDPALQRRVIVEGLHPEVDAGRFPIKRTAGEDVVVGADIFTDGHDSLAAALLYVGPASRAGGRCR